MDGFKLSPAAELMFQQAYWNDKRVHALNNGMIIATGIARVWRTEEGKLVANVRSESGAWHRFIPLNRLRLVNPEEGE